MDMRIPPLNIKILLELNPLKSGILVRRLAVAVLSVSRGGAATGRGLLAVVTLLSCLPRAWAEAAAHLEGTKGVPRSGGRK